MKREVWKDIKGYEGIYQVGNYGKVKSLDRISFQNNRIKGKILNLHNNKNNKNIKGYLYVDLYRGTKQKYYVHRLVADAFLDNIYNYPQINHKDCDTYNNYYENLEWCTSKYNNNYGDHSINLSKARKGKASGKDNYMASVICLTTNKVFDTITEAAKYYNIENLRSHISSFCNGNKKNFKYIGKLSDGTKLQWMYYEDYIKLNKENDIVGKATG